jgi:hypothetical protein
MSLVKSSDISRYTMTPEKLRHLRLFTWFALAAGLCMIPYGMFCLRRDRPSLQWPNVPGVMMQADVRRGGGRHSSGTSLNATYSYEVNGTRHVSHQVRLWHNDLNISGNAASFARAHPVRSTVTVYYDPQNPANAVLIPGANEFADQQFIWSGPVVILLAGFQLLRLRKQYARMIAQSRETDSKAGQNRPADAKPPKSELSAEPFMSYEPGAKRKLNCFPDNECLLEVLGHQGKKLQDWTAEDRVIDWTGRLFRLVPDATRTQYELAPTGETWSWQKILELATRDASVIRKDPAAIRRQVERAPEAERIRVIMQCVDALPSAPIWIWVGFGLFLLLVFLAVMWLGGLFLTWLLK